MMRKLRRSPFSTRSTHRRRFSPLVLVGVVVSLAVTLVGAVVFVLPHIRSHAANAINGDCSLIVPARPLTAQGLATPYQLVATNPDNGACNEANPAQAAFVQAAVIDPATGKIAVYDPLIVDQGTQPAMAPVVPVLPRRAVVGIWFGSNGNTLTLQDTDNSLQNGRCVNGIEGSIFGQVSYCNAPAFFRAANAAIRAGKLVPPPIGRAKDGLPCPTVRDFAVVDQDQSDNVTTTYLVTGNGQTAQMTAANAAAIQNTQVQHNGSDNRLLAVLLDTALGCKPWMARDLADPGKMTTALPLNELQAAAHQAAPVALVPSHDPMVLVNNNTNLNKLNAYRVGVDQPMAKNMKAANTSSYCRNLLAIAPQRMLLDAQLTKARPSADPAAANSLFTFLAQRFVFTYEANGLNCTKLIGQPDPISVTTDGNGVAIDATINDTTISTPVDCSVNGTVLVGCTGTTTINGQTCSFVYDKNANQVKITCPAAG
jgi:hypothetical protein